MLQALLINLFLSYLSFDVPTKDRILLLTREDQGGLYATAIDAFGDRSEERQITVSLDDDCDCEECVELEDAFDVVSGDIDVIHEEDNGNLLLYSALFDKDEAPDFLLENEDGRFYFLKRKHISP